MNQTTIKRPELLTVICILTFIGSGLAAFSNIIIYLNYNMLFEAFNSGELTLPGIDLLFSFQRSFYFLGFLLYLVSLYGAIKMWRLQRPGFHFYSIAQIFLLMIPYFYVRYNEFPLFGILITVLFISLYASNLKHMN